MNAAEDNPAASASETTSTDVETALDSASSRDETGEAGGNDETRAPEEESQSQIPGDPRPPHQTQPPTKEQY